MSIMTVLPSESKYGYHWYLIKKWFFTSKKLIESKIFSLINVSYRWLLKQKLWLMLVTKLCKRVVQKYQKLDFELALCFPPLHCTHIVIIWEKFLSPSTGTTVAGNRQFSFKIQRKNYVFYKKTIGWFKNTKSWILN